jgi:imidazolonepropionase-like amidohydrolase
MIDLSDRSVLPGVMDAHVHLAHRIPQGTPPGGWVTDSPMARRAMVGVLQARETLLAGFTTVRDIGNSGNYVDTELRMAVEAGIIWGPTIVTAGQIIAPYGAQSRLNPERPGLGEVEYIFADTPDEMVKAVRQNVHFGAQVIKIVIDDQEYLYSAEDVRIIVDEAARSGRKVAAHVLSDQGARNAIQGGVASLEHAWGMSDETLDLARDSGVVIVTSDFTVSAMRAYGWSDDVIDMRRELVVDRMRRALARNVEIVFGSDLIWGSDEWDRGSWAMEQLDSFTEAGATPLQVLRAVTVNAARLMDMGDERGRIAEGYAADIIAVDGNPLEDISTLMDVSFVMKDGRVARDR